MSLRINDTQIDWESSDSHYFFNPKHPQAEELKKLAKKLPVLKSHIYLFTSNLGKICLLSKSAFLNSARAVNTHLQTDKKDSWLITLPLFHVAALSVLARSFCGSYSYKKMKSPSWSPQRFKKELEGRKITLSSLVPTQLYDLVQQNISAPRCLRTLVIGGDGLSPFLYKKAQELGWPVLVSYGLTETCSQIACSELKSLNHNSFPKMKLLNHILFKQNPAKVKSSSLLTAYFDRDKKKLIHPFDSKGYFKLPDQISVQKNCLKFKSRKEDQIKILAERVDLKSLSFLLQELAYSFEKKFHLLAVPDERKGHKLVLLSDSFDFSTTLLLVKNFNKKVLAFEKIQAVYFVSQIESSHLAKFRQRNQLESLCF